MSYRVIVGNIGTVYDGGELSKAKEAFKEYKAQSVEGCGRAASEPVTLMVADEILCEYQPATQQPKPTNNDK